MALGDNLLGECFVGRVRAATERQKGFPRQRMHRRSVNRLRVIVYREGEWLCAQSVDFALGVHARSERELYRAFRRLILGHIKINQKYSLKPFEGVPAARKKYLRMFESSSSLEVLTQIIAAPTSRSIKVPRQEVRVLVAPAS